MKIIIDAFGGDYAPLEIVKGAITSVNLMEDVSIILVGKQQEIQKILDEYNYKGDKIEILNAETVITNDESPTMAIRSKKDSSLVVGLNKLKESDDIAGFISAGSTGAVLSGGTFIIGRMEGVFRPALAPQLPNVKGGKTMLIDTGNGEKQNDDYLAQFFKDFGVSKIDYLILTHPDSDHIGGALNVVENFEIGKAFIPHILQPENFASFKNVKNLLEQKHVPMEISSMYKNIKGEESWRSF